MEFNPLEEDWENVLINIKNKNLEAFKDSIEDNPSLLRVRDPNGLTILHVAVFYNADNIVKYLLDMGMNSGDIDNNLNNSYHYAAMGGNSNALRALISHPSFNKLDLKALNDTKNLPLEISIVKNNSNNVVQDFINVDAPLDSDYLKYALYNKNIPVLKMLIDGGVNIKNNILNEILAESHLSLRPEPNHILVDDIKKFLNYVRQHNPHKHRSIIRNKNQNNLTPLHYAAMPVHSNLKDHLVKFLLDQGADPNAKSINLMVKFTDYPLLGRWQPYDYTRKEGSNEKTSELLFSRTRSPNYEFDKANREREERIAREVERDRELEEQRERNVARRLFGDEENDIDDDEDDFDDEDDVEVILEDGAADFGLIRNKVYRLKFDKTKRKYFYNK